MFHAKTETLLKRIVKEQLAFRVDTAINAFPEKKIVGCYPTNNTGQFISL